MANVSQKTFEELLFIANQSNVNPDVIELAQKLHDCGMVNPAKAALSQAMRGNKNAVNHADEFKNVHAKVIESAQKALDKLMTTVEKYNAENSTKIVLKVNDGNISIVRGRIRDDSTEESAQE